MGILGAVKGRLMRTLQYQLNVFDGQISRNYKKFNGYVDKHSIWGKSQHGI